MKTGKIKHGAAAAAAAAGGGGRRSSKMFVTASPAAPSPAVIVLFCAALRLANLVKLRPELWPNALCFGQTNTIDQNDRETERTR